jgi:N-terminal acetyltransferase B complex non-catalytic subunit
MEHLRMRITHEPISSDIIDMELIELKFIFDRCKHGDRQLNCTECLSSIAVHHDNRDFDILANYQPKVSESLITQTQLFGKGEGVSLLCSLVVISYLSVVTCSLDGF